MEQKSKLYNTKEELVNKGLKINKFPHPESILSANCKYGVVTNQLHRYNVACTRNQDFIPAARKLHAPYIHKGYTSQESTSTSTGSCYDMRMDGKARQEYA